MDEEEEERFPREVVFPEYSQRTRAIALDKLSADLRSRHETCSSSRWESLLYGVNEFMHRATSALKSQR